MDRANSRFTTVIITVALIIMLMIILSLSGCAINTAEDGHSDSHTRPMFIVCLLAACEHEIQDKGTTGSQTEGAQDVDADADVELDSGVM